MVTPGFAACALATAAPKPESVVCEVATDTPVRDMPAATAIAMVFRENDGRVNAIGMEETSKEEVNETLLLRLLACTGKHKVL